MKKLLTLSLLTLGALGTISAGSVLAQNYGKNQNPMGSMVQVISEKFSLNQDEVQTVFDQERTEHQIQMKTERENQFREQLEQGVTDGELTAEQKELILNKRQELENWSTDNGIELRWLMGGFGGRGGPNGPMTPPAE